LRNKRSRGPADRHAGQRCSLREPRIGNRDDDCTSRRESADFTDESRSACRNTVIVTEDRGLTRVVKIDAGRILLYEFRRERMGAAPSQE
jgi:hypothetical protein